MPRQIVDLFPLTEIPTTRSARDDAVNDPTERTKRIQGSLIIQRPVTDEDAEESEDVNRPGSLYERYRHTEDLPASAKAFYEKTGMR